MVAVRVRVSKVNGDCPSSCCANPVVSALPPPCSSRWCWHVTDYRHSPGLRHSCSGTGVRVCVCVCVCVCVFGLTLTLHTNTLAWFLVKHIGYRCTCMHTNKSHTHTHTHVFHRQSNSPTAPCLHRQTSTAIIILSSEASTAAKNVCEVEWLNIHITDHLALFTRKISGFHQSPVSTRGLV